MTELIPLLLVLDPLELGVAGEPIVPNQLALPDICGIRDPGIYARSERQLLHALVAHDKGRLGGRCETAVRLLLFIFECHKVRIAQPRINRQIIHSRPKGLPVPQSWDSPPWPAGETGPH